MRRRIQQKRGAVLRASFSGFAEQNCGDATRKGKFAGSKAETRALQKVDWFVKIQPLTRAPKTPKGLLALSLSAAFGNADSGSNGDRSGLWVDSSENRFCSNHAALLDGYTILREFTRRR